MLKHYVEFFYPGSFISETNVLEVAERDVYIDLPKGAYAYRFFSQEEVELDGELLRGKPKDYSHKTFYGEKMSLDQVKALSGNYHILISNMECNKWDYVVKTIFGNFQPLQPDDVVVESK